MCRRAFAGRGATRLVRARAVGLIAMLACPCGVLSGCGAARLGQFERFAEVSVAYADAADSRVTVYASSGDVALAVSQAIHALPRLGDSGDGLAILPGMDTVGASSVDTGFLPRLLRRVRVDDYRPSRALQGRQTPSRAVHARGETGARGYLLGAHTTDTGEEDMP